MVAPRRLCRAAGCLASAALTSAISAQSFSGLGVLPGGTYSNGTGVSADGSVAVGYSNRFAGGPARAFRWTAAHGMTEIDTAPEIRSTVAYGVSGNGTVLTGYSTSNLGVELAFRWESATDLVGLGLLNGSSSYGQATNADGSIVVGNAPSPSLPHAFRWSGGDGMIDLGTLPGGLYSYATAVSDDGSVIAGYGSGPSGAERAFRWTRQTGLTILDGFPGEALSVAFGISRDGSVIVGVSGAPTSNHPTLWRSDDTVVNLGTLPGHPHAFATATNGDGTVVVGTSTSLSNRIHAFIWTPASGIEDLNLYLPRHGLDLSGWMLGEANGVSADGLTIIGSGIDPCGRVQAWRAVIDPTRPPGPPCRGDFNRDGNLDPDDLGDFITCYFSEPPCLRADFNGSCQADPDDLGDFITAYFAGCL